ncbi:MAG: hypothetical protein ACRDQI_11080 [Pseudonocardiaceae bacterium]
MLPLSGFRLLDDEFVFVESLVGEQRLHDPEEIAPIIRVFEALRDACATGGQVVDLIQRVAAEMR